MKALILACGQGTRMQPLTLRTPKCLLPISGLPNIIHIINSLNKAGINEIYVSINESQLKINDFLKDKPVNLIIENQEDGKLGSIGGLKYAINKIGADDLIVIGADNFISGIDFKAFSKAIKPGKATLALYNLPEKYMVEYVGIVELDGEVIKSFQEKPTIDEAKSQLGSTMIYGLSKEWIKNVFPKYFSEGNDLDTIGGMWQWFCDKDELHGFIFNGLWADIGNPRAYVELNNKKMNDLPKSIIHDSVVIGDGSIIKDNVIIEEGCVIGKNCVIGPNVHLMHDSTIGENSTVNGSIIFENVHISRSNFISNSVIDGFVIIKNRVRINDFCVIGYKCIIDDESHLIKGSKVWPFLKASGIIDGNIVHIDDDTDLTKSRYWL